MKMTLSNLYYCAFLMVFCNACILQRQSYTNNDDSMGYELAETLAFEKPQNVKRKFPLVDFEGSRAKEMILALPSAWDKTEVIKESGDKIKLIALYHEDDVFLIGFQTEADQKIVYPLKSLKYPHYLIDELYTKIEDPKKCYLKTYTKSKKETFISTFGENSYFIARLRPTYE